MGLLTNDIRQNGATPGTSGSNGLSILTTAVFAVGEMAGSGVLSLPNAMVNTGVIGIVLNVVCAFVSAFTGVLLGKCWLIILDRYPEYRDQARHPYPTIGQAAFGRVGRLAASVSVNLTLFGSCTVFLLLASENIQSMVHDLDRDLTSFSCYWVLIVTAFITPLTLFGRPKDFWPIAILATVATSTACILIIVQMFRDQADGYNHGNQPPLDARFFLMSFGTITFAFGGHSAFLTFQTDMKKPEDWGKAVSLSYVVVLAMYLPVAITGFYVYGRNADPNILQSMSRGPIRSIVEVSITMHLLASFIILINPVCLEIEEVLRIPKEFNWKRIVSRLSVIAAVLFVAESVPHFGVILDLIGGSTSALIAFVLPCIFYLKLASEERDCHSHMGIPLHIKVACVEVVVIGLAAGCGATYAAISELLTSSFSVPCYLDVRSAG